MYAKFCMHSQLLFFRSFHYKTDFHFCSDFFMSKSLINARVASGGWVPMGQGAATAITPQGGRTPTGLPTSNPNTSPSPPLRHPSHWGQKPSGSKMNKPLKQREKKPGRRETLNQKSGGREGNQKKRYATTMPRHANKASSTMHTQRRHMACACAEATYRWTGICPQAHEQW